MFELIRQDLKKEREAHRLTRAFDRHVTMEMLLNDHPELIPLMTRRGLHCVGCLLAPFHDITDAAFEHGQNEDELYEALLAEVEGKSGQSG